MKLTKLYFENYKAFAGEHELELRPLTILIGRNNSGKSALARLPLLLREMFSPGEGSPLPLKASGVTFGQEPRDLFFEKPQAGYLSLGAETIQGPQSAHDEIVNHFKKIAKSQETSMPLRAIIRYGINPNIPTPLILQSRIGISYDKESYQKFHIHIEKKSDKDHLISSSIQNVKKDSEMPLEFSKAHINIMNTALINTLKTKDLTADDLEKITHYSILLKLFFHAWPRLIHMPATRANPRRLVNVRGGETFTDAQEHYRDAVAMLYQSHRSEDPKLFDDVSSWYETNTHGWHLELEGVEAGMDLLLKRQDKDFGVHIMDAGSAMGQSLPIVVLAHKLREEETPTLLITEEPEGHLHPGAHGALADLYMKLVKDGSPHAALVETHSEVFCLRVQRRIAEGTFKPEDVVIYWIEDEEVDPSEKIRKITINRDGTPSFWPKGIFSEDFIESKAILKAKQKDAPTKTKI